MPEYLTVSQYAALIGVSEKTARKRITRGDVKAERVPMASGGSAWHVFPDRLEAVGNRLEVQNESESAQNSERLEAVGTVGTLPVGSVPTAETGEVLALLKSENEYLKAQIDAWRLQAEAANRTAAEASAALREALKSLPKALPDASTPNAENASRENATGRAQTIEPAQPTRSTPNVAQRRPQREMRPLWKVILGIRS
jgi:hypothetical protein